MTMSTNKPQPPLPYQGGCLCGAVRYEVNAELPRAPLSHCSMCRKAHGAAFATYATVPRAKFRFTRGAEGALRSYESSPGILRSFCMHCGSPLSWSSKETRDADEVDFTLGTLDAPIGPPQQWHIYTASKASWYDIEDHHPQWPERKPEQQSPKTGDKTE